MGGGGGYQPVTDTVLRRLHSQADHLAFSVLVLSTYITSGTIVRKKQRQIKLIRKHRDNFFILLHAIHYSYAVVVSIFHFWPFFQNIFFLSKMCSTHCKAPFSNILYIDQKCMATQVIFCITAVQYLQYSIGLLYYSAILAQLFYTLRNIHSAQKDKYQWLKLRKMKNNTFTDFETGYSGTLVSGIYRQDPVLNLSRCTQGRLATRQSQ